VLTVHANIFAHCLNIVASCYENTFRIKNWGAEGNGKQSRYEDEKGLDWMIQSCEARKSGYGRTGVHAT